MAQIPRTGSVEQILRLLAALATSPAYTAELQALVANITPALTLGSFEDVNSAPFTINIDDLQFGGPSGWLGLTRADSVPGFAKVWITDQLRIPGGPFPMLELVAAPGRRGTWNERHSKEWFYTVNAITICVGSDSGSIQREALAMADAFEQLIYRNQVLGGLVDLIDAPSGPKPSGAINHKDGNMAGALVVFDVRVIRVSGLS